MRKLSAEIFVVTHGKKENCANPGMTEEGMREVQSLKKLLPTNLTLIISGTGKRHLDVARALGIKIDRYTAVLGGPESLEKIYEREVILLADGTQVRKDQYTTLPDTEIALKTLILSLPGGTVVCAGRPTMIMMLGKTDAKSAAVYRITKTETHELQIREIEALGETQENTV